MDDEEKNIVDRLVMNLRHDPDDLGVDLGRLGWASLEDIRSCLHEEGLEFPDDDSLREVLEENSYGRLEFEDRRVRSKERHTTARVQYPIEEPEDFLWYKSTQREYERIKMRGFGDGLDQYIRLHGDRESASESRSQMRDPLLLKLWAHDYFQYQEPVFCQFRGRWYLDREAVIYDCDYIEPVNQ